MVLEYQDFVSKLQEEMLRLSDMEPDQLIFRPGKDGTDSDCLMLDFGGKGPARTRMAVQTRDLFEERSDGSCVTALAQSLLEQMRRIRSLGIDQKGDTFTRYDEIREHLIIRPLPLTAVSSGQYVFRQIGDIALVLYLRLGMSEGNLFTSRIRRDMLSSWQVPEVRVLEEALENTLNLSPPRLYSLEKMILEPGYKGDRLMDPEDGTTLADTPCGTCLSTVSRIDGAVAPFLPGVSLRIARLLGEDFYLAFTSVHEAMIHRVSLVTPDDLETVLRETIEETTRGSEFLSYGIYRYYSDRGVIEPVGP